jgi:hypothetical protein
MPTQNRAGATARIFNERRAAERSRAIKGGLIRFDRGTMECVVRNLSSRGARLSLADIAAVPGKFQIKIGPDGEWRNATARWRRGNEVGVSFDR